jgi:hypothetical protein
MLANTFIHIFKMSTRDRELIALILGLPLIIAALYFLSK